MNVEKTSEASDDIPLQRVATAEQIGPKNRLEPEAHAALTTAHSAPPVLHAVASIAPPAFLALPSMPPSTALTPPSTPLPESASSVAFSSNTYNDSRLVHRRVKYASNTEWWVGDRCEARWMADDADAYPDWYTGTVRHIYDSGACYVDYDSGESNTVS